MSLPGWPAVGALAKCDRTGARDRFPATLALNNTLYHWGAIIVPLGYTVHEVFSGGEHPYGASFTESYTRTTVVRGIFRNKAEARAEALELLQLPDHPASARATRQAIERYQSRSNQPRSTQ